jgi:hypothetical protein
MKEVISMNEVKFKEGSLIVTFQNGVDENNELKTYTRTFRNVSKDASVQGLITTANAFSVLVGHPVDQVERVIREIL